jgi:hypothetical protein
MKTFYKYKNQSTEILILVGFGIVQPGEFITSSVRIENPNLIEVTKDITSGA